MGIRDTAMVFLAAPTQILSGFIGMIFYWIVTPNIYRESLYKSVFFSCIHGLLTFVIGVVISCLANVLMFANDGFDFESYGFKPAVWLLMYGSIPSLFVGMFYLLGRRLTSHKGETTK